MAYYPAPKNASTTLRGLFFRIENGRDFVPFRINGSYIDLFTLYGHNKNFERAPAPDGFEKVAVVREPISRFKANYRWLVRARHVDFGEVPEINDFVARFESLRTRSPKGFFHLQPQALFVGTDLTYFDRVFKVEELGEMIAYLSARSGLQLEMPWANKTREAADELSPASIARLRQIYSADFRMLGALYEEMASAGSATA